MGPRGRRITSGLAEGWAAVRGKAGGACSTEREGVGGCRARLDPSVGLMEGNGAAWPGSPREEAACRMWSGEEA